MRARLSRAEQQEQTRESVIAAAERLFERQGFHATSVDQVAKEAGYTKGAVYSNFASKEDLFFAVYERRVDRSVEDVERALAAADDPADALGRLSVTVARRRGTDDGWMAAFFEFWAHVVRKPELRDRFAALHGRALEPFVGALEDYARRRDVDLPDDPRKLTVALYAMQLGLSLERLTLPDLVDEELGSRMGRLFMEDLANGSELPAQTTG